MQKLFNIHLSNSFDLMTVEHYKGLASAIASSFYSLIFTANCSTLVLEIDCKLEKETA